MKFLLFTLILLIFSCGKKHSYSDDMIVNSAIVGGQEVEENEFLGVLQLTLDKKGMCTATLIDPKIILTAAHCLDEFKSTIDVNSSFKADFAEKIYNKLFEEKLSFEEIKKIELNRKEKSMIKIYLEFLISQFMKSRLDVHLGKGKVDSRLYDDAELEGIEIERLEIDEQYLKALRDFIFQDEEGINLKGIDIGKIYLKKPILDVPIVELATKEEFQREIERENLSLKVVGYGLRESKERMKFLVQLHNDYREKYDESIKQYENMNAVKKIFTFKPKKSKYLTKYEEGIINEAIYVNNRGFKAKLDLKVTYVDHEKNNLELEGADNLQGACSGDSGGPVLMYVNKEKKWKQVGVVSSGYKTCAIIQDNYTMIFKD